MYEYEWLFWQISMHFSIKLPILSIIANSGPNDKNSFEGCVMRKPWLMLKNIFTVIFNFLSITLLLYHSDHSDHYDHSNHFDLSDHPDNSDHSEYSD